MLFVLDGRGYLEAWCYSANDAADLPAGPDGCRRGHRDRRRGPRRGTQGSVAGWWLASGDAPLVTLEIATLVGMGSGVLPDRVGDRSPWRWPHVSLQVTDPSWLRSLLLRLQGGARVVAPEGAGRLAAEAAREALDQYAVLLGTATAAH